MVRLLIFVLSVATLSVVFCKPIEVVSSSGREANVHHLFKRFINTALASGNFDDNILSKIRTKRGVGEECEKLQLCMLHARSSSNFLAAYELYFVNKENARLWDHQAHSAADCERRFAGCRGAPARTSSKSDGGDDYDDDY